MLETLNDVGASEYLGIQTLTIAIFTTWLNRGNLANAAQMACALLIIVIVLFAIERYSRKRRSFVGIDQSARQAPRIRIVGYRRCAGINCLPAAGSDWISSFPPLFSCGKFSDADAAGGL